MGHAINGLLKLCRASAFTGDRGKHRQRFGITVPLVLVPPAKSVCQRLHETSRNSWILSLTAFSVGFLSFKAIPRSSFFAIHILTSDRRQPRPSRDRLCNHKRGRTESGNRR